MQALVKQQHGDGHVTLQDWPRPSATAYDVVLDVAACGVCGTDLEIIHDRHKNWPPVVLGHEYTGTVASVGSEVTGWSVGDRAVCEQHTKACGRCFSCRTGAIHLCESKRAPGWGIDGGFAEQLVLPARLLHRVPANVNDLAAAMTEPTAICLTGLDRVAPRAGETAVVFGPGTLGLITAMLLRAHGLSVVLAGRATSGHRLAIAAELGLATAQSDNHELDSRLALTAPHGVDLVVDTSGNAEALNHGLRCLRRAGRVLELGMAESSEQLDTSLAMQKAASIMFSLSSEYSTWDRALALMASGVYDPTPLARTYPLHRWADAFNDVRARRVIKALLIPGQAGQGPGSPEGE